MSAGKKISALDATTSLQDSDEFVIVDKSVVDGPDANPTTGKTSKVSFGDLKLAVGTQGAPGADGNDGAKGDTGADGSDGAKGDTGADGSDGAKGDTGADGSDGAKGDTGQDGQDAPTFSFSNGVLTITNQA